MEDSLCLENTVCFHDGQLGRNGICEIKLEEFNSYDLQDCDRYTVLSLVIYTKK